jgi:hypothetical protein
VKYSEVVQHLSFDSRLTEWCMKNKIISEEDLNKHLKALPDQEGRFEMVKIEELRYGT